MKMLYLSLWNFVNLLTFSEALYSADDCLITQLFMYLLFVRIQGYFSSIAMALYYNKINLIVVLCFQD